MTRPVPTLDLARLHSPIAGDGLTLELLTEAHRADLKAACAEDLAIWEIYSVSFAPDRFDASFALLGQQLAFVIRDDTGKLVGMTAYTGADVGRQVVEVGYSYIIPALRGTGFNGRVKAVILGHAFACGVRRVEFRVDARNARSQAAVAKIGGVREGVLRADRITWTGHVRDTVLFSILRDEWRATA